MGALSAQRSKFIHKLDTPAFDWPMADFPQYKYPLHIHCMANKAEDKRWVHNDINISKYTLRYVITNGCQLNED